MYRRIWRWRGDIPATVCTARRLRKARGGPRIVADIDLRAEEKGDIAVLTEDRRDQHGIAERASIAAIVENFGQRRPSLRNRFAKALRKPGLGSRPSGAGGTGHSAALSDQLLVAGVSIVTSA